MRNRLPVLPAVTAGLIIAATAAAARPSPTAAGPGVAAADAAGGQISETITRAYKIASW